MKKNLGRISILKLINLMLMLLMLGVIVYLVIWISRSFYSSFWSVPGEVEVPNVLGKGRDEAKAILERMGLKIKVTEARFQEKYQYDQVISQDPAGRRVVRKGREVSVVVSLGPEMIDVPDLTGQSLRDVNVTLTNLKLKVGKIIKKKASKAEPGHVISQNPPAGTKINKGKKVDLVVSEGSEPLVRVPDWKSKPLEEAKRNIDDLDLRMDQVTWVWSEDVQKGTVISQSLESGSLVSPGSFISLEVSAGRKGDEQVAMKQAQVSFLVPDGSRPLEVKVTLTDSTGTFVIYKSKHSPGETIDLTVSSIGDGEVLFYVNGQVQKRVRI